MENKMEFIKVKNPTLIIETDTADRIDFNDTPINIILIKKGDKVTLVETEEKIIYQQDNPKHKIEVNK